MLDSPVAMQASAEIAHHCIAGKAVIDHLTTKSDDSGRGKRCIIDGGERFFVRAVFIVAV